MDNEILIQTFLRNVYHNTEAQKIFEEFEKIVCYVKHSQVTTFSN